MNRKTLLCSFAVIISTLILLSQPTFAQLELSFPNELKGLEFYGRGKLEKIKLGVTRSEDWEKVFGSEDDEDISLNENWNVSPFIFVDEGSYETTVIDGIERKYALFPNFVRTLWEINISPKKRLSFKGYKFPAAFEKGFGGSSHNKCSFDVYSDKDGLTYTLISADFKEKGCKPGDLVNISYEIPERFNSILYLLVEEKQL